MISSAILIIAFLLYCGFVAWGMAVAADKVGSRRGKLRFGLLAQLSLLILGFVLTCIIQFLTAQGILSLFFQAIVSLVGPLLLFWLLCRSLFQLRGIKVLAPVGANIAINLISLLPTMLVIKPYLVEAFVTTSESMLPTIEPNDRILANKIITPQRWDLVVVRGFPNVPQPLIKRIVAFPGETIGFSNDRFLISGKETMPPETLGADFPGRSIAAPFSHYHTGDTIQLRQGEYFFLGDNCERSLDSRVAGPVKNPLIVGVVDAVYWPAKRFQIFR